MRITAKKMTLSEGGVEGLMSRFDTNGDGQVDWREFLALVRSSTELEMMFKALHYADLGKYTGVLQTRCKAAVLNEQL